jgi:DNA-binding CsgD family transcriptional regulator
MTETEHTILDLMCKGFSNAQIAEVLQIDVNTVKIYVKTILQKFRKKAY